MNWWKKFIQVQYEYHFGLELSNLRAEVVVLKALKEEEIEKPIETGEVSIFEALVLFKQAFPDAEIYLSDPSYILTSLSEAHRFLKQDALNLKEFEQDVYDCDNFSKALWGYWQNWQSELALGILWITKPYSHALNVAILTDENGNKGVYVIEPQNDKIYEVPKDYIGRLIVM